VDGGHKGHDGHAILRNWEADGAFSFPRATDARIITIGQLIWIVDSAQTHRSEFVRFVRLTHSFKMPDARNAAHALAHHA